MKKIKNIGTSFSTLLKEYNDTVDIAKSLIEETKDLVTKVYIKPKWSNKRVRVNETETPPVEYAATVIAEQIEEAAKEVEEAIAEIEKNKEESFSFACNSYEYLNKIYEGTPTGEMGVKILENFRNGTLTNGKMRELMEELEEKEASSKEDIELTEAQKKAIDFIISEREERTTPVVEQLARFKGFKDKCARGNKIINALLKEDVLEAERLLEMERDLQQRHKNND
jgi:hypothetical protein